MLSKLICVFAAISITLPLSAKLRVTVTTTHIADLVEQIGGDVVEVEALMAPGVDPHLYKPAAPDVRKLTRADLILYNGLFLEGQMGEILKRMETRGARVRALAEAVPVDKRLAHSDYDDHYDPHVWLNPGLWAFVVDAAVDELSAVDPANKSLYLKNGASYKAVLAKCEAWADQLIGEIPEERRILVTSHDAFNYFGDRFAVEVVAIQGISTAVEAGLADISSMVNMIKRRNIPAIFVESSVSPAAIERVSRDAGAKVGGELFSDSLGVAGQVVTMEDGSEYPVDTWEGMFRHNVLMFTDAVK